MAGRHVLSWRVLPWLGLLVPVALVGLVKSAERRQWSALLTEVADVESRLRAVPFERESIVGETTDGRAWEHYDAALASVRARGIAGRDLADFAKSLAVDDAAAREERARWLADWSRELEYVRHGASARDVSPTIDWKAGLNNRIPRLMGARLLTALCVADGVGHLEGSRPDEAMRCFLTAMQLGRDWVDHPVTIVELIGCDRVVPACLLDVLAARGLRGFDDEALDAFEAGLAALDASWPREITCLRGEPVLLVRHLELAPDTVLGELADLGWTWRYLGSTRVAVANGVRSTLEFVDELGDEPTRVPLARLEALEDRVERIPNQILQSYWSKQVAAAIETRRLAVMRLRSLRCAIAVARGRPAPPVDDPFGLTTTVAEEDGQVVVRIPLRSGRDPIEVRVRR